MVSITKSLIRGIADEIEFGPRPHSQSDSLSDLIDHVQIVSARASAQMRAALSIAFPQIGWSESEDKHVARNSQQPYWVYDPIDGAYHYLQGLPLWSSTLALVIDGRTVMAHVYDPSSRELFYAEAGGGSWLNGKQIHASSKTDLHAAVVGIALPPYLAVEPVAHEHAWALMSRVSKQVFVTRQMAAASLQLAYVAAGRLDAYIESGTDVHDWLAAALIVQEAGGSVAAHDGTEFGLASTGILASASTLHSKLQAALRPVELAGGDIV